MGNLISTLRGHEGKLNLAKVAAAAPEASATNIHGMTRAFERMTKVASRETRSHPDAKYYALLDPRDPEDQQALKTGSQDCALYINHKNLIKITSHSNFERLWNLRNENQRSKYSILRPYWFGYSFTPNITKATDSEDVFKIISDALVKDLTDIAFKYKTNPDRLLRTKNKYNPNVDEFESAGDWRTWFMGWASDTTYLLPLVRHLVDGDPLPKLPRDCIFESELEQVKANLVKKGIGKKPVEVDEELESLRAEYKSVFKKDAPKNTKKETLKTKIKEQKENGEWQINSSD